MRYFLSPFAILAIGVTAEENAIVPRAHKPFCQTIKSLVTAANQQSAATAFCSSYIHISGATSTSTTTTTTVTTINAGAQSTVTATSTSIILITPTCAGPGGGSRIKRSKRKGQSKPKPKPSCLSKYTASAVLSSACSCLRIPHGTTTTIVTSTATSTSTIGGGTSTTTTTVTTTTPGPVQTPNSFRVYVADEPTANGRHLLIDSSNSGQGQGVFVSLPGDTFQLKNGQLVSANGGLVAYQHDPSVQDTEIVYFNSMGNVNAEGGLRITCSIVAAPVGEGFGCALQCSQGDRTVDTLTSNAGQPYVWQLESPPSSGLTFTLMVEAAQ